MGGVRRSDLRTAIAVLIAAVLAACSGEDVSGGQGGSVRVIRGDPNQTEWWDLTLRGSELDAHDGKLVSARIGLAQHPPERLGSGQTRIENGAFELFFPAVWEAYVYKFKLAFIDVDGNGNCDPVDLVFSDARATPDRVLTLRETPVGSQTDMNRSGSPADDCASLNAAWPTD